ncbi:MAG: (deoxy)nucleoside triphosphate pyrophosphohydrolase [Desulfuromonadaceae bacterium]
MVEVGAAIIVEQGRILLGQRLAGSRLGGYWEFPGGKVEPGESLSECIEREILEELGVRARSATVICESVHTYPFGAIKLLCVHTFLQHTELKCNVHAQIKWVALQDLPTYNLAPADVPAVEHLLRYFSKECSIVRKTETE